MLDGSIMALIKEGLWIIVSGTDQEDAEKYAKFVAEGIVHWQ